MKVEMIFMTAVLGIGAMHLLFNLVNFLARFKRTGMQKSHQKKVRQDWYVFFETSALYGHRDHISVEPEVADDSTTDLTGEEYKQYEAYA